MNKDITALSQQIQDGLASQEDIGVVLRTIQISLGAKVVSGMETVAQSMDRLNSMVDKAVNTFSQQIEDACDSGTITWESLAEIVTKLQKNQLAFIDLQRKIVQSPNKLFPEDVVSPEERQLLELIKSFKTPDEKKKFFASVQKAMQENNILSTELDINQDNLE